MSCCLLDRYLALQPRWPPSLAKGVLVPLEFDRRLLAMYRMMALQLVRRRPFPGPQWTTPKQESVQNGARIPVTGPADAACALGDRSRRRDTAPPHPTVAITARRPARPGRRCGVCGGIPRRPCCTMTVHTVSSIPAFRGALLSAGEKLVRVLAGGGWRGRGTAGQGARGCGHDAGAAVSWGGRSAVLMSGVLRGYSWTCGAAAGAASGSSPRWGGWGVAATGCSLGGTLRSESSLGFVANVTSHAWSSLTCSWFFLSAWLVSLRRVFVPRCLCAVASCIFACPGGCPLSSWEVRCVRAGITLLPSRALCSPAGGAFTLAGCFVVSRIALS